MLWNRQGSTLHSLDTVLDGKDRHVVLWIPEMTGLWCHQSSRYLINLRLDGKLVFVRH